MSKSVEHATDRSPATPPTTPSPKVDAGFGVIHEEVLVAVAPDKVGEVHAFEEEALEPNSFHQYTDEQDHDRYPHRAAAREETVEIKSNIVEGTGTPAATVAVAQAALARAEAVDVEPPADVVAAGAQVLKEAGVEVEDEVFYPDDDKVIETEQLARTYREQMATFAGRDMSAASASWNVSQCVSPQRYDPTIPYITGFSNGTEITDPIILHFEFNELFDDFRWLKGALYRNGPGIFDIEFYSGRIMQTMSFEHWFDGLPLVHRFEIDGWAGEVQYRSRFTGKGLEQLVRKHAERTQNGQLPNMGRLGFKRLAADSSAACANLAILPGFPFTSGPLSGEKETSTASLLATSDSVLQEIDPVTLLPKRAFTYADINPKFKGSVSCPVPCWDASRNVLVNYTMDYLPGGNARYTFFEIDPKDQFTPPGIMIASIHAPATHAHSFALTNRYIILIVYPFSSSWRAGIPSILAGTQPAPMELQFDTSGITSFHVIDRMRREEVAVFRTGPLFALTVLNAHDSNDGESIEIDINAYDSKEILSSWRLNSLRKPEMYPWPPATIRRYVLSKIPEAATVFKVGKKNLPQPSFTHRTDYTLEMSCINPRFAMKAHRFAWGLSITPAKRNLTNVVWDALVLADLTDKTKIEWREAGCYPGEPIMVPSPVKISEDEDAGVLLSVVLNSSTNTSFLLMLKASSMEEIGRANLPVHIPFGFHGAWTGELHG
ncbi:hypothetical protein HKX48_006259 [Thoreauomyces humboldtii]|nr:hypothetical protein HKX48_006259 [Thoreauomyces humboldtii]